MKTVKGERARWELNDRGISDVVRVERTRCQLKHGGTAPRFFPGDDKVMSLDKVAKIKPGSVHGLIGRFGISRATFSELREEMGRDQNQFIWDAQNLRPAMRPIVGRVAFTGHRPIQLRDPRRVIDGRIHNHAGVIKLQRQDFKHRFDEISTGGIVGQVNPVQAVSAIAAVRPDGLWPALRRQPVGDRVAPGKCRSMLQVSGADLGRSHGIAIDQDPDAPKNIGVAGGGLRIGLEPVLGSGQQR